MDLHLKSHLLKLGDYLLAQKKKKRKDFNVNPSWSEVADMELIRLSILRS